MRRGESQRGVTREENEGGGGGGVLVEPKPDSKEVIILGRYES